MDSEAIGRNLKSIALLYEEYDDYSPNIGGKVPSAALRATIVP
jgi:hypothetical protein